MNNIKDVNENIKETNKIDKLIKKKPYNSKKKAIIGNEMLGVLLTKNQKLAILKRIIISLDSNAGDVIKAMEAYSKLSGEDMAGNSTFIIKIEQAKIV